MVFVSLRFVSVLLKAAVPEAKKKSSVYRFFMWSAWEQHRPKTFVLDFKISRFEWESEHLSRLPLCFCDSLHKMSGKQIRWIVFWYLAFNWVEGRDLKNWLLQKLYLFETSSDGTVVAVQLKYPTVSEFQASSCLFEGKLNFFGSCFSLFQSLNTTHQYNNMMLPPPLTV